MSPERRLQMKKIFKRGVIALLGVLLLILPFVLTNNLNREKRDAFDRHEVISHANTYEMRVKFSDGPITESQYYDLMDVLAYRMDNSDIDKINVFTSEDHTTATFSVGFDGDCFLDGNVLCDMLLSRGELQWVTIDEEKEEVKIWLDNDDIASVMDCSSYDAYSGNKYGVLYRVNEESLEEYKEMCNYSISNNIEVYIVLDGEIIDDCIFVSGDKAPSKNIGYGGLVVRADNIVENTKLLMVGAAPVLDINIERIK